MTKYIFLIGFSIATLSISAQDNARTEAEIRALEQTGAKAILNGDVNTLKQIWAPEFLVNTPRNEVTGTRDSILLIQKAGMIDYSTYEKVIERTENIFPNIKLSKIRYATDGGYYDEAKKIAENVQDTELATSKERIEFRYRKARLFDKSGFINEAVKLYQETIELQGEQNWYFAPNSCLQLGYIAINKNNLKEARAHFEKALTYKKHEYKNSIDSKAKSALAQMGK
jgi:tetratricopeptide (TPR) repeat protein